MSAFSEGIQQDVIERVSAITDIERALFMDDIRLSENQRKVLQAHSISMLYSLWEGFVQKSFNLYIDEINKLNGNVFSYVDTIVIHHMECSFPQFRQYPYDKLNKKMHFFNELGILYGNRIHTIYRIVNTENNVSFKVLNKLLNIFSLTNFSTCWGIYTAPHPNLEQTMDRFLHLRNAIAHGGDIDVGEKQDIRELYEKFKKLITTLMYEIQDRMENGLKKSTFLKK